MVRTLDPTSAMKLLLHRWTYGAFFGTIKRLRAEVNRLEAEKALAESETMAELAEMERERALLQESTMQVLHHTRLGKACSQRN